MIPATDICNFQCLFNFRIIGYILCFLSHPSCVKLAALRTTMVIKSHIQCSLLLRIQEHFKPVSILISYNPKIQFSISSHLIKYFLSLIIMRSALARLVVQNKKLIQNVANDIWMKELTRRNNGCLWCFQINWPMIRQWNNGQSRTCVNITDTFGTLHFKSQSYSRSCSWASPNIKTCHLLISHITNVGLSIIWNTNSNTLSNNLQISNTYSLDMFLHTKPLLVTYRNATLTPLIVITSLFWIT